ncbi:MAG TPA: PPC domain-containing DNA-binding protein [Rhizomicrobium sp.]|nr:PPC domain-containing DNA-binding protein [Rhizomicrobium sp.]
MKPSIPLLTLLLAIPAPLCAQTVHRPATAEDLRPNNPKVPDAYALTGRFDRIVVMRMKFKTDLLHGMEQLVKKEHIQNGVILSGIGSLRGYRVHNVASRDYPPADVYTNQPTTPADLIGMNGYIVHGNIHAHMMLAVGEKATAFAGHLEPGSEVLTYAIVTVGVLNTDLGRVDDQNYR